MQDIITIFTVTVVYYNPEELEIQPGQRFTRTWGYFFNFEDAEMAVLHNHTDMFEQGYYNYAVIEELPEGLLPVPEHEYWYQADFNRKKEEMLVSRINKPQSLEGTFSFSMG